VCFISFSGKSVWGRAGSAEFSYLWPIAAAIKNPYLEIDSSCYQKKSVNGN